MSGLQNEEKMPEFQIDIEKFSANEISIENLGKRRGRREVYYLI